MIWRLLTYSTLGVILVLVGVVVVIVIAVCVRRLKKTSTDSEKSSIMSLTSE